MARWTCGAGNYWLTDTGTVNNFDSATTFNRWAVHQPTGNAPPFSFADIRGAVLRVHLNNTNLTTPTNCSVEPGSTAGDSPYNDPGAKPGTIAAGGVVNIDWSFDGLGHNNRWDQAPNRLNYLSITGIAAGVSVQANSNVIDVGGTSYVVAAPDVISATPIAGGTAIAYSYSSGLITQPAGTSYNLYSSPDALAWTLRASGLAPAPNTYVSPIIGVPLYWGVTAVDNGYESQMRTATASAVTGLPGGGGKSILGDLISIGGIL